VVEFEPAATLALIEDDLHEPGVFEATSIHEPIDLPAAAVLCFFNDLLEQLHNEGELEVIYTLRSEIGRNPIYRYEVDGRYVTVAHPGVGAPLAAGFTEEIAALGVRTFAACGGAGALVDLNLGHVMIVNSAVRDEGTSFHYAAPSRVINATARGIEVLQGVLDDAEIPYFIGRTWTTDALFRETRSRVSRRVSEGCQMVDMESSAFMAVAQYRGLNFAHVLYAGDTLAGDTWDSRSWDKARSVRERLFRATARAALALHDAMSDDDQGTSPSA
jgi:uridine phosphorylase